MGFYFAHRSRTAGAFILWNALVGEAFAAPCDDCNVVWIVVDTTRADYLGSLGADAPSTPNLDALAARGTLFSQAYAQAPATMLSTSSYFSGRRRLNTGMDFDAFNREADFHPLSPQVTTVAEVLQGQGIRTRGVTANMLLSSTAKWNLELYAGFETWESGNDALVEKRGIALLDELKEEQFFLYLHFMGPHIPNEELDGFAERRGAYPEGMPKVNNRTYGEMNKGRLTLSEQEQDYLRALYADSLWQADGRVGRVLQHLESTGLQERTLVVVISDHGEALGDEHLHKPVWGHGHALSEPLLHVPLILAGPGVTEGEVRETQIAELVDIAPTLTELLGIPGQDDWKWEGESLVGPTEVQGQWSIADRGAEPKASSGIRNQTHAVTWWQGAPDRYFYWDLTVPGGGEMGRKDHVSPTADHLQLQEILREYVDSADPPPDPGKHFEAPEDETLKALQELGYLE